MEHLLNELETNLEKVRLKIWDSSREQIIEAEKNYKLGKYILQTTHKLKYLGTYLTRDEYRKETVEETMKPTCSLCQINC